MSKVGLTFASLLLTGSLVGLGFSSYYVANANKFGDTFKEQYANNPKAEIAFAYGNAAENLEEAASNMGNYVVTDDDILIIYNPDKGGSSENLGKAIVDISKIENPEQYIKQIVDINKEFSSLDVNYKDNAPIFQELKNETRQLSNDLENLAIEANPNYLGINSRINDYGDIKALCVVGIFFASIGVIGFGIWTLAEASDVLESSNYTRRKRNKP